VLLTCAQVCPTPSSQGWPARAAAATLSSLPPSNRQAQLWPMMQLESRRSRWSCPAPPRGVRRPCPQQPTWHLLCSHLPPAPHLAASPQLPLPARQPAVAVPPAGAGDRREQARQLGTGCRTSATWVAAERRRLRNTASPCRAAGVGRQLLLQQHAPFASTLLVGWHGPGRQGSPRHSLTCRAVLCCAVLCCAVLCRRTWPAHSKTCSSAPRRSRLSAGLLCRATPCPPRTQRRRLLTGWVTAAAAAGVRSQGAQQRLMAGTKRRAADGVSSC
jgi:hypothetical protein